jgi:uncharacterized SAM-binding protein YcdF (DUF218 family)
LFDDEGQRLYELNKIVGALASPLMGALLGGLLAWGLAWRGWRRAGLAVAALSLGGLWVISTPWVAWALAMPLESKYPPVPAAASPVADAALVLGGALASPLPPEQPHIGFGMAADRVWHAAALYRAGKARWVLAIGGNRPGYEDVAPEAEAMAEVLRALGVPASALRLEGRSRNTRENAVNSLVLVRQVGAKRVLLVTSALHMPRAMAVFQGVFAGSGVTLIPAATDAEALGDEPWGWAAWLPDAKSLEGSTRAVKEVLGLAQVGMTTGW